MSGLFAVAVTLGFVVQSNTEAYESDFQLPELLPDVSPLAKTNQPFLSRRIKLAFDHSYQAHLRKNKHKSLAEGFAVYYLRQELQALIDMYRATGQLRYLHQARVRVLQAISEANANPKKLLHHGRSRGVWPCFLLNKNLNETGGHSQICDFQGAAGFLMVAHALKQADQLDWEKIADFVEEQIVEKWLFYIPSIKPGHFKGKNSDRYLLITLEPARDKREHFATICMDLDNLGYKKYLYGQWARLLTNLYVGHRASLKAPAPNAGTLGKYTPADWGLVPNRTTGGYIWYYLNYGKPYILDTSHANRTIWLAAKAHDEGLVKKDIIEGLINTLKYQIWAKDKGPFYFNNIIDGRDLKVQSSGPGKKGNLWFGWHRLAAYDPTLRDLFISIAYDLTNSGPGFPQGAQNKHMENAPLCFYAWAARLLSLQGKPERFP